MDQILQILIQNGYIDEASAKDLQDLAQTESKTVRQLVIDQEILSEDDLLAVMAAYQDTEAIDLGGMTIETEGAAGSKERTIAGAAREPPTVRNKALLQAAGRKRRQSARGDWA